jgi:Fe2+ transport system protein B
MSTNNGNGLSREHLIHQVANRLVPELRAEYYRILRYCRSLPESDELLIVLNTIQLFFSLSIDVPNRIAAEGEKIDRLLQPAVKAHENTVHSFQQYQAQLDQRLAQLPEDIAKHIQPEAIAAAIYESVRQEFVRSGYPQMGQAFQATHGDLQKALAGFNGTVQDLTTARKEATNAIRHESATLVQAMHHASESVIRERERLSHKYRWQRDVLALIAIIITFVLGMRYALWLDSPIASSGDRTLAAPVVQQPAAPAIQPKPREKTRRN